ARGSLVVITYECEPRLSYSGTLPAAWPSCCASTDSGAHAVSAAAISRYLRFMVSFLLKHSKKNAAAPALPGHGSAGVNCHGSYCAVCSGTVRSEEHTSELQSRENL